MATVRSLLRSLPLVRLIVVGLFALALAPSVAAAKDKPEKIPIAMGKWDGPHAATFKGAVRKGAAKDCKIVAAKSARVLVEGEVTAEGKGFAVKVIVKSTKTNEVVEQREFKFSKPSASAGQANKMGRAVTEIARRAPTE